MQAQLAEAVTHENKKLHQLTDLQKAIIRDLQRGRDTGGAAATAADSLSEATRVATKESEDACQLRESLLAHTGHAKVRSLLRIHVMMKLCIACTAQTCMLCTDAR